MKKFGLMLLMLLLLLSGCTGGQEIESGLFVIAMAVDAAPEGNLTVTVKALSGTEDGASGASGGEGASDAEAELEKTEPGYIVLSATAPSCLRALGLLGATTPRTVNLSQLREIVVSQTLAETDATLSILKEIRAMPRLVAALVESRGHRRYGSAALECIEVASGRAGAFVHLWVSPWDIAAAMVICAEAGVTVTRLDGTPLDVRHKGSILAGAPRAHAELLARLVSDPTH